jgi:DNA modification methylase
MTESVAIGNATLYHADCRDVLPTLPKFDLVLTDPPYGINAARTRNSAKDGWVDYGCDGWDIERAPAEIIEAILTSGETVIIWGGNYFTDVLPPSMGWLSWDKGQDGFSLADFELAWTNRNKAARRINYPRALALKDIKQHPTQKPIAVMEWCLSHVPAAQTILDPFMGSGTTGVACANLGKTFTGIERERKYFDIACERIERAYAQERLFA